MIITIADTTGAPTPTTWTAETETVRPPLSTAPSLPRGPPPPRTAAPARRQTAMRQVSRGTDKEMYKGESKVNQLTIV